MRSLILVGAIACAACAHQPETRLAGPEIEVALDDGRASERPLTPGQAFEMLVRIDPRLPAYRPHAMRLLLAQPGHIVVTIYAATAEGRPGAALLTLDRSYGPELLSSGDDGKWLLEDLSAVGVQRAPIFVGLYSPEKSSDPRLWASSNDSGCVFQRDVDTSLPLDRMKIPRTPKLRVSVLPEAR